ncbi:aminopeptidase [Wenzhouxiangella sp. EGI_FJ10409]|uniref:aminopeptidase n=1 Tax=Wenzhouxiangella sp. EGI_FJ10409 TaxID=3243767 RepID=UPI0035DDF22B
MLLLLALLSGLAGCATVAWYGQAARGQIEILAKREDIAELMEDPATSPRLRERLATVLDIRAFAIEVLGLPDSRSYTLYADLERDAPLWNVVATPAYSIEPETWCYPLVGCLAYRGFFRRERAEALAVALAAEDHDVAVFPATAYSTLGWFADPVLDSMLELPEASLAELIFHELTHEMLYVSGDTAFNEALATFVGRLGARRWLAERGQPSALARWRDDQALDRQLTEVLLAARERLATVYEQGGDAARLEAAKQREFERLRDDLRALAGAQGSRRIEAWVAREINNAHLALVATYESGVAAFESLYRGECEARLPCLYERARALAEADRAERAQFLEGGH